MTGREQTRRDAATLRERASVGRESALKTDFYALPQPTQDALYGIAGELEPIADRLDALLAELEQAEARLAKVPALVEALRKFYPHAPQTWKAWNEANSAASDALADYEHEQT